MVSGLVYVGTTSFTFSKTTKQDIVLSISTASVFPVTEIATAAAISDGLNSKKSMPAFNSQQAQH